MRTSLIRRSLPVLMLCGIVAAGATLVRATPATGTLYVHFVGDSNPGTIHLEVRKHSGALLAATDLAQGQTWDKTFPGLTLGPQEWYVVAISWPSSDFHNIGDSNGNIVASGTPATANNRLTAWQVSGNNVNARVPILMR